MRFRAGVPVSLAGEAFDDRLDRHVDDITPQFLGALDIDMARNHGQLHTGKPQSYCGSIGLPDESFTYERNRWYAGGFGGCAGPQHGGRAAPSTSHAGDDGVGLILFEL